jgi:hypothetical protein
VNVRIDNIDPQGELAMSLLREAAAEVRPLYSSTAEGAATPGNTGLGPREVYVAAWKHTARLHRNRGFALY